MNGRSQRESVAVRIERERISAIIRTDDPVLAGDAMNAAVDGGFRMVEFTLTIPGALDLVTHFAEREELLVGAGTVLTIEQAQTAAASGARFLVSPIVDPDIIREAARLDVPIIPGAYTPTEMETAHRLGADFVKIFPATAGGVGFVQAVRGPLPHLRLFPTAGVTIDNFLGFLDAGCAGVGFVRPLFEPEDLATRNMGAIRDRAASIMSRLAEWRASQ